MLQKGQYGNAGAGDDDDDDDDEEEIWWRRSWMCSQPLY